MMCLYSNLGGHLTYLSLIGLSILRQLDELFGEHATAISQDVAFQLDIRVGS